MKTNPKIHLIEPTLFDQTGHGYSYAISLIEAKAEMAQQFHVWLDKRGHQLFKELPCTVHPYFFRRTRQLQKLFLYAKLLRKPETIFVATTELLDLQIVDFLQSFISVKAKLFFHFHQFKQSPKKLARLSKIAKKNPHFHILAPTQGLIEIFKSAGFKHCTHVPCPSYRQPIISQKTYSFGKVIYAGAARTDKGFPKVIELVEYLANKLETIPMELQVSPPNSLRYDTQTKSALDKLEQIQYQALSLHKSTLNKEQYLELFQGSISLLVYDYHQYANKFSGVTLDALMAGCPIITTANTWMGEVAERFKAGIALSEHTPEQLYLAISAIKANYDFYHQNALKAASILINEHDPINTLKIIS